MNQRTNNLAAYIWSLADRLRDDIKQSQYGRIVLPFTLLRSLEGVLEQSKAAVMDSGKAHQNQMMQLLSEPSKAAGFAWVVFDLLNSAPNVLASG